MAQNTDFQQEMQEQMQQQMKQRLENLPRFTYKVTRFFKNKSDLQQAIDDLNNGGIPNLNSKKLSNNYIDEIYEMCFLFKIEGKKILKAAIYGALLGGILGLLQGIGFLSFPILNPISAGGMIVSTLTFSLIISTICAAFTAIVLLYRPIKKVDSSFYMLTVYSDYENKQNIEDILNKHVTFEI
ncbi:magnesium transporter [Clostridium caseinilyticum]|uniref:Magnesium transporter n=2 Tax=Clostridium TaxID=1485 RepID=A0AAE4JV52_CLOSG|nr:magnesium transporter [Clostridium sporogenes]MDS1002737.1 magnesium transporter [Clostridium sporogenes]